MDKLQGGNSIDTIIIGCGMSGLAAGIRLAMFGQKVLILERHSAPGGLNSFYALKGRKFDVGLHAVTNYVPQGHKGTPLPVLFRQLRIPRESFDLWPQKGSRIAFPESSLRFSNSFGLLESEVEREFPGQIDGFRSLRRAILEYRPDGPGRREPSAREVLSGYISEPLLMEMLLCPIMYYGSSRESDMYFSLFVTLWKSVFEEGFARPGEGIRTIIRVLLDRYREAGGIRRMNCGVRRIVLEGQRAVGVELDSGEILESSHIISTAGWPETELLCGKDAGNPAVSGNTGRLAFAETISVLDRPVDELGCADTIVFFNDSGKFSYEAATGPIDLRSGIICCPGNYDFPHGTGPQEGILRVTTIASYPLWKGFPAEQYVREKKDWFGKMLSSALRFVPGADASAIEAATVFRDMFTPRTVEKYTGRLGGAIYGAPEKALDGRTGYENLYLAGTDQGLLGIVGAMFSGVSIANRHVLAPGN